MTNTDQGREGVKNPENLADVICAWPLTVTFLSFVSRDRATDDLWEDRDRQRKRERDRPDFFSSKDILLLSIFPSLSELGGRASKANGVGKDPLGNGFFAEEENEIYLITDLDRDGLRV